MSRESLDRCMNDVTEGDPLASYQLGLLYLAGDDQLSVKKDEQLAMTYLRHAADSGVLDAQLKMAHCFQLGIDGDDGNRWPKDSAEAIYYYRLGTRLSSLAVYLSLIPSYLMLLIYLSYQNIDSVCSVSSH